MSDERDDPVLDALQSVVDCHFHAYDEKACIEPALVKGKCRKAIAIQKAQARVIEACTEYLATPETDDYHELKELLRALAALDEVKK